MTKVEAIEAVMKLHGGSASLKTIYDEIEQFYPTAKVSKDWDAGLRGVLYRDIYNGKRFKKIGDSIYALTDYTPESIPSADKQRMHSFIEGICVELGNSQNFQTFTADPSAMYRDKVYLRDLTTLTALPEFTYPHILHEARLIDVLWFDQGKYPFPKYAFEVVDSIGTLDGAFKRCFQLANFRTKFYIIAPEKHHAKFEQALSLDIYSHVRNYFEFKNYDSLCDTYDMLVKCREVLSWLQ